MRERHAAAHGHGSDQEDEENSRRHGAQKTNASPVEGISQLTTAALETKGLLIETIRLVDEQFDAFATFQDLFNVLDHALTNRIQLRLHLRNIVVDTLRVVLLHERGNGRRKGFVVRKGNGLEGCFGTVGRDERFHQLIQKGGGDAVLGRCRVRHAQASNAGGRLVMELVGVVVLIRHLAILGRNLVEKNASDGGEIARGWEGEGVRERCGGCEKHESRRRTALAAAAGFSGSLGRWSTYRSYPNARREHSCPQRRERRRWSWDFVPFVPRRRCPLSRSDIASVDGAHDRENVNPLFAPLLHDGPFSSSPLRFGSL